MLKQHFLLILFVPLVCWLVGFLSIIHLFYFIFYINIDLEGISDKTIKTSKNETIINDESETEKSPKTTEKIVAHDALTPEQIDELRHKTGHEHSK
jgi:hypothetical protein